MDSTVISFIVSARSSSDWSSMKMRCTGRAGRGTNGFVSTGAASQPGWRVAGREEDVP